MVQGMELLQQGQNLTILPPRPQNLDPCRLGRISLHKPNGDVGRWDAGKRRIQRNLHPTMVRIHLVSCNFPRLIPL